MDKKHCIGCSEDFYNHGGRSHTGECWMLKDATHGKFKLIPVDLAPPYNHIKAQSLPTCYSKKRYVKVKPESLTAAGYWQR